MFVQSNGIENLLPLLSTVDETLRVEAVRVLSYLSKEQLIDRLIFKESLFMRLIVLIDEGMQLNTEYMQEQVQCCLKVILYRIKGLNSKDNRKTEEAMQLLQT
jgi:hypothetical protein